MLLFHKFRTDLELDHRVASGMLVGRAGLAVFAQVEIGTVRMGTFVANAQNASLAVCPDGTRLSIP